MSYDHNAAPWLFLMDSCCRASRGTAEHRYGFTGTATVAFIPGLVEESQLREPGKPPPPRGVSARPCSLRRRRRHRKGVFRLWGKRTGRERAGSKRWQRTPGPQVHREAERLHEQRRVPRGHDRDLPGKLSPASSHLGSNEGALSATEQRFGGETGSGRCGGGHGPELYWRYHHYV